MHPYRRSPDRGTSPAPGEELILYVALCAVGAIPVAAAVARSGVFGVEATLGLLMILAGLAGLASRMAARHPADERRPH